MKAASGGNDVITESGVGLPVKRKPQGTPQVAKGDIEALVQQMWLLTAQTGWWRWVPPILWVRPHTGWMGCGGGSANKWKHIDLEARIRKQSRVTEETEEHWQHLFEYRLLAAEQGYQGLRAKGAAYAGEVGAKLDNLTSWGRWLWMPEEGQEGYAESRAHVA
ncbi:hypothetical protein NDU88_006491 [Pleurodeles waltl]|uniref:Uncharacterized protein n=1 Tax=Pleurodeles waltl TaxID=8319 RepID=A0AAV7PII4_PLEWA|nr:hypothetical protein NDU88_006491 [Pleurodeles waltl]